MSLESGQSEPGAGDTPIPRAALDNLASRFRPGGVHLLFMGVDGRVLYEDEAAVPFFRGALTATLRRGGAAAEELGRRLRGMAASGAVEVWDFVPGVLLAALPWVERKAVQGVIVLAARSALTEAPDAAARELPCYCEEAMQRQARLLLSMVRDQVRLVSLDRELDSLSGQLANTYEELSLIYQLSSGMKINRRTGDFFQQACRDLTEVIRAAAMGVVLCGDGASIKDPVLHGEARLDPASLQRLGRQLIDVLARRKGSLLIHHLDADAAFDWLGASAQQLLAVPLMRQDQVLGAMFALDKRDGEFDSVDTKLLTSIANESAIYLENAMLFEDVHGLMMGLLHSLSSAVDAKDAYTCGHSERVAMLCRELAIRAGLTDGHAERVYIAGLLHDVGKIGVPESVLQKTGRLTAEEFAQMKRHPEIGARILRDVKQIQDIVPGVLHHHERYDGRGYPGGLSGEEIPLMGRIICLADCFDAMTSNRTYRRALPLEVALTEIRRGAGTQFDPVLSDAFLEIGEAKFRQLLSDQTGQVLRLNLPQPLLRSA